MLNLAQIQHHDRHSEREGYGFLLLCFYLSEVAFALGKAELPLDFNALILVEISLSPVTLFILPRSAHCGKRILDGAQVASTISVPLFPPPDGGVESSSFLSCSASFS